MVRCVVSVLLVAAVAVLATEPQGRRRSCDGSWVVGSWPRAVALAGFAFMVASGRLVEGVQPFAYRRPPPGLRRVAPAVGHVRSLAPAHWRVSGRAARVRGVRSPESGGSLGWAHGPLVVVAVGLALVLTFSFAWMGALVVVLGFLALGRPRPRWVRLLAVAACSARSFASSWIVNVGLPVSDPGSLARGHRPCAEVDVDHQVSYVTPDKPPRCSPLFISWPYAAPLTPYLDAKERALRPVPRSAVGGDRRGAVRPYQFAARLARRPTGSKRTDYDSPHCAYLGVFATSGLFAGLGLLVLVA